ncbi:MAG: metallophosphoesterase [Prevotella sp.]|nr:metallophosphoesterase [Prevotella sp.]
MIRRLLIVLAAFVTIAANSQTATEWKECAKGNVRLIVANDLGRNGYYDQKPIASLMGEVADGMGPDAVLALGDIHHYGGVRSVSDPLWMTNYETVYTHPELLVDWMPICGNHEYRGNTQAMIDYSGVSRRWNMPARYYTRTFESKGTTVKVVFIDTTPLIDKYRNDAEQYPDACKEDMDKQLKWLDSVLSAAKEDWVLVAGHHPVYAETSKAEYERADMQRRVDAVLRRHKVDMYLCGHIHNFQHIRAKGSDIDYIVNSSASLSRKVKPVEGTQFCSGETGFSLVTADKKALNLYMINRDGKVLHTVTRNK